MTIAFTILGFLKRIPWQAWAGLALIAAFWWTYHSGYQRRDALAKSEIAAMVAEYTQAQADAGRLAQAAKAATELRYRNLAERIDNDQARNQANARDAANRYITANRVRPQAVDGSSSSTASPASDNGAGLPAPVSAGIIVGEADVLACTDLYTYAASANAWAGGLGD